MITTEAANVRSSWGYLHIVVCCLPCLLCVTVISAPCGCMPYFSYGHALLPNIIIGTLIDRVKYLPCLGSLLCFCLPIFAIAGIGWHSHLSILSRYNQAYGIRAIWMISSEYTDCSVCSVERAIHHSWQCNAIFWWMLITCPALAEALHHYHG